MTHIENKIGHFLIFCLSFMLLLFFQMEEALSIQRVYHITTTSSMNLLVMVEAKFLSQRTLILFGYYFGSAFLFFGNRDFRESPSKLLSEQGLFELTCTDVSLLLNQESNHMLLYAIVIYHRRLKMSMGDGLVERFCIVLIFIFQISHFMLGQHALHKSQNKG